MSQSEVNPILGCLEELFSLIADIQKNLSDEDYDVNQLRSLVIIALNRFEANALAQLIDNEQIYKTKYALAACIDEWVIRSVAGRASSWLSHPLQLELFNDSHAGEQFFNILSELRLQGEKYIDVLEVYYLCLDLGYQGHYRLSGKTALQPLKYELLNQILLVRKIKDLNLSDEVDKPEVRVSPPKSQNYLQKAAIAAGAFLVLVSVTLWVTMSVKAGGYRKDILKHQHQLMAKYHL